MEIAECCGCSIPSMRNLLDIASAAQNLDGNRLTGSLLIPERNIELPSRETQQVYRLSLVTTELYRGTPLGPERCVSGQGAGAPNPVFEAPAVSMSVRGRRRFPLRAP